MRYIEASRFARYYFHTIIRNGRRETNELNITQVYTLLYRLGITAEHTAFFHTAYAVYLAAQQPERLCLVTKNLYPEVARYFSTTWRCVERSIRLAAELAWQTNPGLLEALAHHPSRKRLTASKFLAILAAQFFIGQAD